MTKHYFDTNGSYGDAEGLVLVDTTGWTKDHWEFIQNLSDGQRAEIAEDLAYGKGSIDQQDCPYGWQEEDPNTGAVREYECGWTGYVYRQFDDPDLGEDGGYWWTCPQCGSEHIYEGSES